MASWVHVPDDSDFSLRNLPYGVFSATDSGPRIGIAIGEYVLDVKVLAQEQVFDDLDFNIATLEEPTLNAYASLGKYVHGKVRRKLQQLLEENTQLGDVLRDNQQRRKRCLIPLDSVTMHLPVVVGDYTDFFIGLHHANNVSGKMGLFQRHSTADELGTS
jgi:fumarylacetoacetase